MSKTQKTLELNGRKIVLIGTAHVSKESVKEVDETVKELKPDCVAIELDEKRADSIQNAEKYSRLDIIKVIKHNEGFLLLANLILSSFQKRMGLNAGVKPGDEMIAAINAANEMQIPSVMVDRPIQITLKRAWSQNSFWGKTKLFALLVSSAFSKEKVDSDEIENLKNFSEMDSMMEELSKEMPVIKKVLIDERDEYLAAKIWSAQGKNIVAVLGAGHLPGVEKHLQKIAKNEESINIEALSEIPPKSVFRKIFGWIIPVAIIALIILSFIYGGTKAGTQILTSWFLWNAIPSALFSIAALAHPATILVAFFGSPFTSLCPFVGIGFFTAITQAFVCKPKVSDMESLQDDVSSVKTFYKNKILRILLVFILSSLGSSLGTFIGGSNVVAKILEIFKN